MNEQPTTEQATTEPTGLPTEGDFKLLVTRANTGDATALTQLRELLDARPEIWQRIGDLAKHAETLMVDLISAGNKLMAESLHRTLKEMKAELLGPGTSMLERMAVERLLACWLQLQYTDSVVGKSEGGTLANANFQLKRQNAADNRYHAAVKALAELRRLLPKTVTGTPEKSPTPLRVFSGDKASVDAATA